MNDSLNRRHGVALNTLNMVLSLLIGIVYTPIVLSSLGKSEYGVFSLANSLIAYLSILDCGFGNALIRYTARERARGNDEAPYNGFFLLLYSGISIISIIVGIIMFLNIESFFSTTFSINETKQLKVIFIILLMNTAISFPSTVFSSAIRSHQKFVFVNIINILQNLFRHGITIVFLLLGYRSISMAVISLVITVLTLLLNVCYCIIKSKIRFSFSPLPKKYYSEILIYSFFILINILVDQLYASTDNIILGKYCGSVAIAIYNVGITFQTYYRQFSTAISSVYLPHISQIVVKTNWKDEMSNLFIRVAHTQLLILSLILTGFIAFGREFIFLWAGDGYEDAFLISIIIMSPTIIPLSQNLGISLLQALNKHKVRSLMYLVIAIINVLISIPLAIYCGGIGAAIGTAIGNIIGQIAFMNWYYRRIGLDILGYWKCLANILAKSVPILLVFILINKLFGDTSTWMIFIMKILLSVTIITPYYYLVLLNDQEKALVLGIIKRKGK